MHTTIPFSGSIPRFYEDLLTSFLFDGFSADLIERIDLSTANNVLELACGTGGVTKHLQAHLPQDAKLTATDLQPAMIEVAKQQITSPNVHWEVVDMMNIPYKDEQFDLVVCQFGLMLVPEKPKALTEMRRVLKSGGQLAFTVWADILDNPIWKISGKVIEGFLGANPMLQNAGPFSMSEKSDTLELLGEAGFTSITATPVIQTGRIESAASAAKGILHGLPVFMAISKKAPELLPQIEQALKNELIRQLGDQPLISPLTAWVFEIVK